MEICLDGVWGTVTSMYESSITEAEVVCRQLGFPWNCKSNQENQYQNNYISPFSIAIIIDSSHLLSIAILVVQYSYIEIGQIGSKINSYTSYLTYSNCTPISCPSV